MAVDVIAKNQLNHQLRNVRNYSLVAVINDLMNSGVFESKNDGITYASFIDFLKAVSDQWLALKWSIVTVAQEAETTIVKINELLARSDLDDYLVYVGVGDKAVPFYHVNDFGDLVEGVKQAIKSGIPMPGEKTYLYQPAHIRRRLEIEGREKGIVEESRSKLKPIEYRGVNWIKGARGAFVSSSSVCITTENEQEKLRGLYLRYLRDKISEDLREIREQKRAEDILMRKLIRPGDYD